MSSSRRLYAAPRATILKALNRAAHTVQSLITFPEWDQQGDWVQPDGIQWVAKPKVDWEHGIPIGYASIKYTHLDLDGKAWSVPIGTTQFAQSPADLRGVDLAERDRRGRVIGQYDLAECCRVAEQIFELVALDEANGVSVEFEPDPKHTQRVGKSIHPHSGRYPSAYLRCRGVGYAHCVEPVSFNARVLKSLSGTASQLLVIAESGRIAGSPLRPTIQKSLARYLAAAKARPVVVRVEKSMNDDLNALPMPPDDAPMGDDLTPMDDGDDTTPTAKAAYDCAQGLLDLKSQVEELLAKGEHVKGKAKLAKLLTDIEACAEEASAIGDLVSGDMGGKPDAEPPTDTESDDAEPEPEPEALETEDDGALKTKSMYKPCRFRLIGKGLVPVAVPNTDADLEREVAKARRALRKVKHGIRTLEQYQPTGR